MRRAFVVMLPLAVAVAGACKGDEKDPPVDDTTPEESGDGEDTAPPVTEVYTPIAYENLDLLLPTWIYRNRAAKVFTAAPAFQTFTGLTAPSELAAGTDYALVRIGNGGSYPGSYGEFTKMEKGESGRLRAEVHWQFPSADCSAFDIPVTVAIFGLIEAVGRPTRFSVAWEDFTDYSCLTGLEEGEVCSVREPCATGLICQGLTRADEGFCRADELRMVVDITGGPLTDDGVTDFEVDIDGLASVDEDVLLQLDLQHPRTTDLLISLENPAGTEVVLADGIPLPNGLFSVSVQGFSGDEAVNGTWILRVEDKVSGQVGSIGENSRLEVASRFD